MTEPLLPLYFRAKQAIHRLIEERGLQPGEPLPTERELEDTLQVSRVTVRRALTELEREGTVRREHGRGTFVAPPKLGRGLAAVTSFTQEAQTRGLKPGSRLLQFGRQTPPRHISQQLGLAEGAPTLYLERVRLVDDEPLALSQSWLNLPDWVILRPQDLATGGSLWAFLERHGLRVARVDKTVEAILADAYEAEALGIPPGSLFLVVESVARAADGTPIESNRVCYRADRYRLTFCQTR